MAFPKRTLNYIPAEITSNPDIMGGMRVPAMTIVAELREGSSDSDIFDGYPSLPFDGIDAVREWAKANGISLEPSAS